jgi:carboxyl-terminal processing protease
MNTPRTLLGRLLPTTGFVVVAFLIGFLAGAQSDLTLAQDNTQPPPEAEESFGAFWQAYNLIQSDYLDKVAPETLVDGAIDGLMNALDDQFSGYMDPEVFPLLNQDLEGEISGIGVVIRTNEDDEIEVVGILDGTPAQRAGVQPGDIFAEVDGVDMRGVNQTELAALVRGPEGTTVDITFRRGEEMIPFTIERARIDVPNVEADTVAENIGHVRLNSFTPDARQELEAAIESLNPHDLDGLILDFRGNGGGLLDSAIDVASLLIPEGTVLVEDFGDREVTLEARGNAVSYDLPIVLLVDETSASASELVAGAWQDYGLVTVIGETTFGKGTVQTWHPLINGGGVRLTIARWLTPEGNWIHEVGVTPNITIEWNPLTAEEFEDDIQLDAAVDFLQGDLIQPALAQDSAPNS